MRLHAKTKSEKVNLFSHPKKRVNCFLYTHKHIRTRIQGDTNGQISKCSTMRLQANLWKSAELVLTVRLLWFVTSSWVSCAARRQMSGCNDLRLNDTLIKFGNALLLIWNIYSVNTVADWLNKRLTVTAATFIVLLWQKQEDSSHSKR